MATAVTSDAARYQPRAAALYPATSPVSDSPAAVRHTVEITPVTSR